MTIQQHATYEKYQRWLGQQTTVSGTQRATLNARLSLAQEAITYARTKLFHGAGNVTQQVKDSYNYSPFWANKAYEFEDILRAQMPKRTSNHDTYLTILAAQAIAARTTGAGNCDHFAAVVLFYLCEHAMASNGKVFRVGVTTGSGGHSVVVYANATWTPSAQPTTDDYKTAVVVDAWPTHAFAVAWDDWKFKGQTPVIDFERTPQSTGDRSRLLKGFRDDIRASTQYQRVREFKPRSQAHFNKYKSEYFPGEPQHGVTFATQWTEAHSLRAGHPSQEGCFLTTACVEARGLPDSCDELTILRAFRDDHLRRRPGGEDLISEYYQIAPTIVARIHQAENARDVLFRLYADVVACVENIRAGDFDRAVSQYIDMVNKLRTTTVGSDAGTG